MKNKNLQKWAWAVPAALVVLVAIVLGNSDFGKGAMLRLSARRFLPQARPSYEQNRAQNKYLFSSNLAVSVVDIMNYTPYFRISLTGEPIGNFSAKVTYYTGWKAQAKGGTVVKTYGPTNIKPGSYVHWEFDKDLLNDSYSVVIEADSNKEVNESSEADNAKTIAVLPQQVPLQECKNLHAWQDQGVLTKNTSGNFLKVNSCDQYYPFWVTAGRCMELNEWFTLGVLTQNIQNAPLQWKACELYYPNIWGKNNVTFLTKGVYTQVVVQKLNLPTPACMQDLASDVKANDPMCPVYQAAVNNDIAFVGYGPGPGMFEPNYRFTRAGMAVGLANAFNVQLLAKNQHFSDVAPGSWYFNAVEALAQHGFVNGFPDGTFQPSLLATTSFLWSVLNKL